MLGMGSCCTERVRRRGSLSIVSFYRAVELSLRLCWSARQSLFDDCRIGDTATASVRIIVTLNGNAESMFRCRIFRASIEPMIDCSK